MSSAFNPYADWFRLDGGSTAPNNYQLLGLRHFESDTNSIEAAARNRLVILSQHLAGPHSHQAKRLKYEVESARDCLLDPQQRTAYDVSLRSRLKPGAAISNTPGTTTPSPGRASVPPRAERPLSQALPLSNDPATSGGLNLSLLETLSARPTPPILQPFPSVQRKPGTKRKPPSSFSKSIGVVMALVPTAITVAILYWMYGNENGSETASVNPQRPASVFDHASPTSSSVASRTPRRLPRPARPTESNESDSEEDVLEIAEEPPLDLEGEEAVEKIPPRRPRVIAPLGLPLFVDLPSVDERNRDAFTTLFPCAIDQQAECKLAVYNPSSKILGTIATFQAESVDGGVDVSRWLVSLVGQASAVKGSKGKRLPVAEFALKNGAMCFRWLSEGRSQLSHMLRNCLLSLEIDNVDHRVALRTPQKVSGLLVDLDKQIFTVSLASEWLPKATELSIEFLDLENFSGRIEVPEKIVDGSSKDLRIIVKPDSPQMDLQLRLTSANGPTVIRLTPVIVDRDQDELPLTMNRLSTMKRTLPQSLSAAQESFSKNTSKLSNLQAQYRDVRSTSDAVLQGRRALMLAALEKEIQKVQVAVGRANKQIVEAQTRLAVLPGLQNVADQLHQRAVIKCRVFFRVGENEVDVLRAE